MATLVNMFQRLGHFLGGLPSLLIQVPPGPGGVLCGDSAIMQALVVGIFWAQSEKDPTPTIARGPLGLHVTADRALNYFK